MKVDFSPEAAADLEEIAQFIARDNPGAAATWVDKLVDRAEKAGTAPRAGRIVLELADPTIRAAPSRLMRWSITGAAGFAATFRIWVNALQTQRRGMRHNAVPLPRDSVRHPKDQVHAMQPILRGAATMEALRKAIPSCCDPQPDPPDRKRIVYLPRSALGEIATIAAMNPQHIVVVEADAPPRSRRQGHEGRDMMTHRRDVLARYDQWRKKHDPAKAEAVLANGDKPDAPASGGGE